MRSCYLILCWLLGLLVILFQTAEPVVLNNITQLLTRQTDSEDPVFWYLAAFLCVTLGAFLTQVGSFVVFETWKSHEIFQHSMRLYRRILGTGTDFFEQNESVKIVKRIERDVLNYTNYRLQRNVNLPIALLGAFVSGRMMFCGSFEILHSLGMEAQKGNTILALLIIFLSPLQFAFLIFNKIFMKAEAAEVQNVEEGYAFCSEALDGIADLRANGAFPFALGRICKILEKVRAARIQIQKMYVTFPLIDKVITSLTQVVILAVCAMYIRSGKLTFADYMGFTSLCAIFNSYVSSVVNIVLIRQYSLPGKKRIRDLEDLANVYGSEKNAAEHMICAGSPAYKGLRAENIFYDVSDFHILRNISFQISPGDKIALVGPSGSGKTTLLKILARQLPLKNGKILYGNAEIQDLPFEFFCQKIAYVGQKPFLFRGTLEENILMGRDISLDLKQKAELMEGVGLAGDLIVKMLEQPAQKIGKEFPEETLLEFLEASSQIDLTNRDEVENFLKKSGLYERVIQAALSLKIENTNQELSGGQVAKIALARALAGEPDVLLLDEITASLDESSQEHVLQWLVNFHQKKTVLLISHRLNALKIFSRILVLNEGCIVQEGRFEELEYEGLFQQLIEFM